MRKLYSLLIVLVVSVTVSAQTLIYSNNFNDGVGTATIVGNGQIETTATSGFGSVFHNSAGGEAIRSNYLLLPNTVFADLQSSGNKALSISFWVNKGTSVVDYKWTPLFSAYGAAPVDHKNSWPMMILQSRLIAQVNCAGWTDFSAADNVTATNKESSIWLDDAAWHFYTATFTETSVKIYVDGVVQNSWTLSGTDGHSVNGLFTNGSELTYICLGGNQAWDWGDFDAAFMYDDLAIYSSALTVEQINGIIAAKMSTAVNQINLDPSSKLIGEELFNISGAKVSSDFNSLKPGIYIKRSVYSNGVVKSTKIVKSNNR
ncbi:MAG TPA: LamG-like jellyroll fold domain-containing protein [Prolixibacteraceae bacterium]|nr:LamG-like jellyroll fold domain-containing protein [Prolixibacteraceae bacterium]